MNMIFKENTDFSNSSIYIYIYRDFSNIYIYIYIVYISIYKKSFLNGVNMKVMNVVDIITFVVLVCLCSRC
jgi:hypothetical protein